MPDEYGRVKEGDFMKRQKSEKEQAALDMLKKGVSPAEIVQRTGVSREWLNLKRSRRRF
jgi:DNA-binding CsgD family transcriptional regulator